MGDPTNEGVCTGPMARLDLRDELHGQVKTVEQRRAFGSWRIIPRARRFNPNNMVDLEGPEAFDNDIWSGGLCDETEKMMLLC
jgi:hypothetical protein